jgi:hypothetical protein
MDSQLRSVLHGRGTFWSNDKASVRYHSSGDYWTWKTPAGTGNSDMFESVLHAIKPYL